MRGRAHIDSAENFRSDSSTRSSPLMPANTNCSLVLGTSRTTSLFLLLFLPPHSERRSKKERRGFHGKLFHRLANAASCRCSSLVDLLLRSHFSKRQPVSRLFPRKHVGATWIEKHAFFSHSLPAFSREFAFSDRKRR